MSFELGLKRCLGRTELYDRVLQRFLATRTGDPEQIRAALAQGDLRHASRLAHSQISTAGAIGAENLSRTARLLEEACEKGASQHAATLLESLTRQLTAVAREVEQYLAAAGSRDQ